MEYETCIYVIYTLILVHKLWAIVKQYLTKTAGRYRYFTELSARTERYGDFFACSLPGGRKWFVVSSARALRETVGGPQEDAFNGRPEAKTSGVSMFLHHAKCMYCTLYNYCTCMTANSSNGMSE